MSDWITLRDALGLTLRPIDQWPGKLTYDRRSSTFTASLKDTLGKLKKELSAINGRAIVLQIAFRPQDLRLDGLPRAGASAQHPGVILTFESKHGPLALSFDGFRRWEHNLRAIAFHLEHLRMASLYGVGRSGEQYRGWTALPAPASAETITTKAQAAAWLAHHGKYGPAEALITNHALRERGYRRAAQDLHPDASGTHEDFVQLQQVMDILRNG